VGCFGVEEVHKYVVIKFLIVFVFIHCRYKRIDKDNKE